MLSNVRKRNIQWMVLRQTALRSLCQAVNGSVANNETMKIVKCQRYTLTCMCLAFSKLLTVAHIVGFAPKNIWIIVNYGPEIFGWETKLRHHLANFMWIIPVFNRISSRSSFIIILNFVFAMACNSWLHTHFGMSAFNVQSVWNSKYILLYELSRSPQRNSIEHKIYVYQEN